MPTFPAPENVTKEVAQHVLWHFGDQHLGYEGGRFTERLLMTISAADQGNRERLRAAFPEHVALYVIVANTVGGLEWLREIVRPPAPTQLYSDDISDFDGVA
jgi:hypothetical protein